MSYELAEEAAARLRAWYRALDQRPHLADLVKAAWVYERSSLSQRVRACRNLQHLTTSTRDLFSRWDIRVEQSQRPRLLSLDSFDEMNGFGDDDDPIVSPWESFDFSALRSLALETMLADVAPWQWVCTLSPGLRFLQLEVYGGDVPEQEIASLISRHGPTLRHLRPSVGIAWSTGSNATDLLLPLAVSCPLLTSFGTDIIDVYNHDRRYISRLLPRLFEGGHPTLQALEFGANGKATVDALRLVRSLVLRSGNTIHKPRLARLQRLRLSGMSLRLYRGADDDIEALLAQGIEVKDMDGPVAVGSAARCRS